MSNPYPLQAGKVNGAEKDKFGKSPIWVMRTIASVRIETEPTGWGAAGARYKKGLMMIYNWQQMNRNHLKHLGAGLFLLLALMIVWVPLARAAEFLVNSTTALGQSQPQTAALADGSFVVVWSDFSQSGSDTDSSAIRGQRFDRFGTALGTEFLVNTITVGNQFAPDVAALTGGGFVVTWEDDSQTSKDTSGNVILAQRYDGNGVKQGGEIEVNTTTTNDQKEPDIAALSGGGFVIAWRDASQSGADTSSTSIRAQMFDASGVLQGSEFVANSTTFSSQVTPSVASLTSGEFVIVWRDNSASGGDTSGPAIRGQVFTSTGSRQGSEFLANSTVSGSQTAPSVAGLSSGDFVVTWRDGSATGGDTSSDAVRAQQFDSTGNKFKSEFLVNSTTTATQINPSIAALPAGGFVIAWRDDSASGNDASNAAIRGQRYAANGSTNGAEFLVNTITASGQIEASIAGLAGGGFMVAWTDFSASADDNSGSAIRANTFDVPPDGEFLVNTVTFLRQSSPSTATLTGGGFVITWTDDSRIGGDISLLAVKAQRFAANGTPQGAEFLVNTTISANQSNSDIVALSNGGFVVVWEDSSSSGGDTSFSAIRAQIFDANGAKTGSEFLVNTTTFSTQTQPSIAAQSNGGFVVAWDDASASGGDSSGKAIRAQRFDANGAMLGSEFLVNTSTAGDQSVPDIARLALGGFVIAWTEQPVFGDQDNRDIHAQRYDETGTLVGIEFLVNSTTADAQFGPEIVGLNGGAFVISWTDNSATGADTSSSAIRAQLFNTAGASFGSEFLVNTTTIGFQSAPNAFALSDGGFLLSWTDTSQTGDDTSSTALRAQRFDVVSNKQGPEFLVNTTTFGVQGGSSGSALANDGFVMAWQDDSQTGHDTSSGAIRADIFGGPTTVFSSVLPSARSGFVGGLDITVFASAINAGSNQADHCKVFVPGTAPVNLSFQETNPADNSAKGAANLAFDMAPGQARSFILSFTPTTISSGEDVFPDIACINSNVGQIPGVNTVFLSIDNVAVPDVLSIIATPSGNGIVTVPTDSISFMSASATNIGVGDVAGSQDAAITVSVDDGGANLSLLYQLCETDAAANCITPLGTGDVNTTIGSGPSFFAVFISDQSSGGIPLDPANSRVFLRFTDAGGTVRSVTSAAVTVVTP
ncbi:FIG01023050: hypothetical protein [hydrothermal vent metagenome]|uniref:Uncharacterized protein n=1 Tax=hydrothermal vent metagenome TaxID=652676 RepID=A0A3B0R6A2_9ZZZZ